MIHRTTRMVPLAAALIMATGAAAAPVSLPTSVTPGFGATWTIGQSGASGPFSGTCSFSTTGFSIQEASLTTTAPSSHFDAFDIAYPIFVDSVLFDSGSTVDLSGTTVTAGPVSMSGLDVSVELLMATGLNAARILVSFDNPTGSAIAATVDVPVNFGSDSGTIIQGTSSGDTSFDSSDRWAVTSDGSGPSDPINTTVFYGPGNPVSVPTFATTVVFDCATTDGVGATFDITVPAGTTRHLLFFAGLGGISVATNDVADALAAVSQFDDVGTIDPELLVGLVESEILNWDFDCGNGVVDTGEECDDGNRLDGDCCTSACLMPSGCATGFGKGLFLSKEKVAGKEKMVAKFLKGPSATQIDLGDPVTGSTAYHLCVWDDATNLVGSYSVDRAGDTCSGRDCWKSLGKDPPEGKGYKFKDKDLASDGVLLMKWKSGDAGKSKALIKGKGSGLAAVAGALQFSSSVTLQLHGDDAPVCLEMTLSDLKNQDADLFKAK